MPRNVEIKARVSDLDKIIARAKAMTDTEAQVLEQEDTFFNVPNGRLKLRHTGKESKLIQYSRPDQTGPKLSQFYIAPVEEHALMKTVLSKALGVKGEVKKRRVLVLYGQTRIHLDDVEGLGHFMELEVILRDEQTVEEGEAIAKDIMAQLEVNTTELIDCAYMDLLLNGK